MKTANLCIALAALLAGSAPAFAGDTAAAVGFQAGAEAPETLSTGPQNQITITLGTVAGSRAVSIDSTPKGLVDAVFVTLAKVRSWAGAAQACAGFAPKGFWRVPSSDESQAGLYLGGVDVDRVGALPDGTPVSLPPSLWSEGGPLTFEEGVVGIGPDGTPQKGLIPAPFQIDEAVAGHERLLEELASQKTKLDAATPESLAAEGLPGATREQIEEARFQLDAIIAGETLVIAALKKGIPVVCVAGTFK